MQIRNLGLDKESKLYVFYEICFNLIFWVPLFYVFQKQSGLGDAEIFSIQSLYYLFFIGFEIPTGFLADVLGHRRSMVLAGFFLFAAHLPLYLALNFWTFLTHFLGVALARSFASGSASSYIFGHLSQKGEVERYKAVEATARSWGLLAKVLAWTLASWISQIHIRLSYDLTLLSASVALAAALMLRENTSSSGSSQLTKSFQMWRNLPRTFLLEGEALKLMFLCSSFFVLARMLQVHLFQPYLLDREVSTAYFGLIMAGMTLAEALGTALSGWVKSSRVQFEINQIIFANLLSGCAIAFLAFAKSGYGGVGGLILFSFGIGLAFPPQKNLVIQAIKTGELRATILSFESIVHRSLCSVVVLFIGAWIQNKAITNALIFCAFFSWAFGLIIGIRSNWINRQTRAQNSALRS